MCDEFLYVIKGGPFGAAAPGSRSWNLRAGGPPDPALAPGANHKRPSSDIGRGELSSSERKRDQGL